MSFGAVLEIFLPRLKASTLDRFLIICNGDNSIQSYLKLVLTILSIVSKILTIEKFFD